MGQVFKARNWKLGRIVALKLIRKERLAGPEAVRRFHREIRAAARSITPTSSAPSTPMRPAARTSWSWSTSRASTWAGW